MANDKSWFERCSWRSALIQNHIQVLFKYTYVKHKSTKHINIEHRRQWSLMILKLKFENPENQIPSTRHNAERNQHRRFCHMEFRLSFKFSEYLSTIFFVWLVWIRQFDFLVDFYLILSLPLSPSSIHLSVQFSIRNRHNLIILFW